jgi:BlaI family transcriptional regulator, penicillinase repressor
MMDDKNEISLTNSEWVIMEYLWSTAPLSVTQLAKAMEKETGWAKSTTKTLLSRMGAKGFLRFEEGEKARLYYPAVDRSAAQMAETESFLGRVYKGSLGLMVNAMAYRNNLSTDDIDELRAILDRMDKENQDA